MTDDPFSDRSQKQVQIQKGKTSKLEDLKDELRSSEEARKDDELRRVRGEVVSTLLLSSSCEFMPLR